ncbi:MULTISPECIES: tRNA lysidine(34) synthetase TilS [unclassified Lentimonas]|uniref:tRNA lysidine(34) synthetase TilS n=1 Tax=unclassified Lentimonas TaxID=2630993 RepID=UPI0013275244|nr:MULTISPECIES: tRNA lysidine(34) synthetase TilS [unclassified Lentimonas]CAA6691218.1 tRNA(Ile)-lysidine synthetase (EC [Lentimonas sp. CC19]CAA6694800.1 tRNA(Ile)-lysidine synthetase (EC [Lentimonas sp. CC10]CAA7071597.1 tRNA(Ile)-lysidine synthetase (EC [Lentimonas sp. CC11]
MSNPTHPHDWPAAARMLHAQMSEGSLHTNVRQLLTGPQCQRVLVACSGGADSIYMLCQLWAQAADLGVELVVAHYNHRWRGEDSRQDAAFVRELALQLRCGYATADRPENEAAFTETTARALRLDFLRAAAKEHGCQCIAFGHQQNDILETQLQRLARGSGTDGLAAPRPVHFFESYPTHVRPVLHLGAGAIRMALNAAEIPWREDISNEDVEISRNALRHNVIPSLSDALDRDASAGSARSRYLLEEDADALDALARVTVPEAFTESESLDRLVLRAAPRALTRRALSAWLSSHDLIQSMSAPAMDLLMDAVYAVKPKNRLSAGAFYIELDETSIHFESAQVRGQTLEPSEIEAGESVMLTTGAVLETEVVELDDELRDAILKGGVDVACEAYIAVEVGQTFEIRGWLPGDRFRPIGAPGTKKLKDWFIDRQIPVKERKLLPLVLSHSGEVVWVPGFPPADALKISAATKRALRLTYERRNPL